MLTQDAFCILVVLVALQRSAELRVSRRNEAYMLALGGVEHAPGQLAAIQLLHGTWLASMLLEVKLLHPPLHIELALVALLVFGVGQWLRLSAMRALAWRWSVRIFIVPSLPPVSAGIYRYLRHPSYLGVALEVAALPLVHSSWRTALGYSVANAALLWARIKAEERALLASGGYSESFAELPRLWPRWRARGAP
jgi:methyltransferase